MPEREHFPASLARDTAYPHSVFPSSFYDQPTNLIKLCQPAASMPPAQFKINTRAKALGQSTISYSHKNTVLLITKAATSFVTLIVVWSVHIRLYLQIGMISIEEKFPQNDPTKKRWAVMMVGAARSYMLPRNSFLQNVVNQSNPPMDVFAFIPKVSNPLCLADMESMRLLEMDSTLIHLDESYIVLEGRDIWQVTEDRLVRQQNETLRMIDNYAA